MHCADWKYPNPGAGEQAGQKAGGKLMSNHARNHRAYMAAQLAASQDESAQMSHLSHYELLLFKLKQDLDRLKGVESHHRKAQLKRERLPAYQPWVAGVLASDAGAKDADAGQAIGRERH